MRGILRNDFAGLRIHRITPAHAGNTLSGPAVEECAGDHPRACGEYKTDREKAWARKGSPPRMRGIQFDIVFCDFFRGITPAHAGNTGWGVGPRPQYEDHPRACGEYPKKRKGKHNDLGSPPRMRGIPLSSVSFSSSQRITPAHAGNTSSDDDDKKRL